MRFNEILSISGMSGLYKIETQKPSGIIATSLLEGWTKFISSREHLFSMLENISIYTDTDNVNLLDVMIEAFRQKESNPPVDAKADDKALRSWFLKVLPKHDTEKVHISDIRKFIKWFHILDAKGILQAEIEIQETEAKEKAEKGDVQPEEKTENPTAL